MLTIKRLQRVKINSSQADRTGVKCGSYNMVATISFQLICLISLSLQLTASLHTNDFNSLMNEFPLDCLLRDFTFNVTLADDKDRKCSGLITVKTCYGYCETMEVSKLQVKYVTRSKYKKILIVEAFVHI